MGFIPYAEGELVLQNETGRLLYGAEVLVNYEDARGRLIFSITYQAHVKDRGDDRPFSGTAAFFHNVLTRPVRPGEAFDLYGTNLLASTTIPAKADAPILYLEMSGINTGTAGGAGTYSDPILYQAPPVLRELGGSPDHLPDDVLLKLNIDARGVVRGIGLPSTAGRPEEDPVVAGAVGELRSWRFFPAVRDGNAVAADLFMLLEFRRLDFPPPRDCFVGQGDRYPETFAWVILETDPSMPGHWEWLYGGYDVRGWAGRFLGQVRRESTPERIRDR